VEVVVVDEFAPAPASNQRKTWTIECLAYACQAGQVGSGKSVDFVSTRVPQHLRVHSHPVIPDGQISENTSGTTGFPEQQRGGEFV